MHFAEGIEARSRLVCHEHIATGSRTQLASAACACGSPMRRSVRELTLTASSRLTLRQRAGQCSQKTSSLAMMAPSWLAICQPPALRAPALLRLCRPAPVDTRHRRRSMQRRRCGRSACSPTPWHSASRRLMLPLVALRRRPRGTRQNMLRAWRCVPQSRGFRDATASVVMYTCFHFGCCACVRALAMSPHCCAWYGTCKGH